jgi:hypothetical protein
MQLNENTLTILKNFAGLNPNLYTKAGNIVSTVAPSKELMAEAVLDQEFPVDFGIYELPKFLAALSLIRGDQNIEFGKKMLTISDGSRTLEYFYSDPMLLTYPQKQVKMPPSDIEFDLPWDTMSSLKKASSTLGFTQLALRPDKGKLLGVVSDAKAKATSKTENSYTVELGEVSGDKDFNLVLNLSNFNFIPGDYEVKISEGKISQFTNKDREGRLKYWVLFDKESTKWK